MTPIQAISTSKEDEFVIINDDKTAIVVKKQNLLLEKADNISKIKEFNIIDDDIALLEWARNKWNYSEERKNVEMLKNRNAEIDSQLVLMK